MNLKVCRICGTEENLVDIFADGNDELAEQIRLCANIQIDEFDCLPKFVCATCQNGLAFSYHLRKRSEETEKKLRQDLHLSSVETDDKVLFIEAEKDATDANFSDEETWINDEGISNPPEEESLYDRIFEQEGDIVDFLSEIATNDNESGSLSPVSDELVNNIIETEGEHLPQYFVIQPVDQNFVEIRYVDEVTIPDQEKTDETSPENQLKNIEFECEVCFEVLTKKNEYLDHVKQHFDGKKRFHCAVCDKFFKTRCTFDEHMKNHNSKEGAFPCPQCPKSYTNVGNMERHIRSAHKLERKFQCSQCDSAFCRPDVLKLHLAKHSDERSNECLVCKKSFKTPQSLYYHKLTHRATVRRPRLKQQNKKVSNSPRTVYVCDVCNKISNHLSTHLNHVRTHTGEKPYICRTCNKAFRTSHTRSNHELVHTDKRPHECKSCDLAFRQRSHLQSHMLTHTKEKRHVCEVCQKAFAMRSNLVVHLRTHSLEMPNERNVSSKKLPFLGQYKRPKISHIGVTEVDQENMGNESCEKNDNERPDKIHGSQICLYGDDIIETDGFGEDIVVSE